MLRGIYSSASGMIMEMDKVSMHAANIANAQSAGYRKHQMSAVPFKELMIEVMNENSEKKIGKRTVSSIKVPVGTGAHAAYEQLDMAQGNFKPTGGVLDMAIDGNGWLTIQKSGTTDIGNQYTSRNGTFMVNKLGEVVTESGDNLVDINNKKIVINIPIAKEVPPPFDPKKKIEYINPPTIDNTKSLDSRISIKENGDIYDNGKRIAQLKIQSDTNERVYIPQLKLLAPVQTIAQIKVDPKTRASGLYDSNNQEIKVKQGFIEGSNVQIISEMIGMIHASKNYESGHKLITAEDKVLDKAINELGRTG